ncbi:MAG: T9SS type A sorting domain-containing protein [Candidatus Stahlbacteria bacterium]|nr:MAG: T9SS type A sorting domain-containing protein [Candidatus Stahlbacteria bacterium]
MRKIALVLLAGVLVLSAVEWEIEQVTTGENHWNDGSMIALDTDGNVGIVYYQYREVEDSLMFASNATGSWVIKGIMPSAGWASFDFDSKGNAYVVLVNTYDWDDTTEIFLAADTSGEFTVTQLTNDPQDRYIPVIRLDGEDNVHIIYPQSVGEEPDDTTLLFYGWIDEGSFHYELITDQLSGHNYDMVIDRNNTPHVFYTTGADFESTLWHAFRSSRSASPDWMTEEVYTQEWGILDISAEIDAHGYFHIAHSEGWIGYITNSSGDWTNEWASDTTEDGGIWGEFPSIAVDYLNNPHIAWPGYSSADEGYDIYYSGKTAESWFWEKITNTPTRPEYQDERRFFVIDAQGYGHVTYSEWDENEEFGEIFYAKSKEPFVEAIAEQPSVTNPFRLEIQCFTVSFNLSKQSTIRLDLYDASGRRVTCIASGIYAAGEHSIPINQAELATGVYFVRLEAADYTSSAKLVVIR